jgi:hydroxyacylglutathione hydrolase
MPGFIMPSVTGVPAFADNYIWLIGADGSDQVAIVDPGDAEPVLRYLEQHGLGVAAVLITHHHADHIGGVNGIIARHPAPVYGPANDGIACVQHALAEGDVVDIPAIDAHFQVLDVPGHTRGHIAYLGHGMLFIGDTLFSVGCGRLFEGTPVQMYLSLEKIRALPDDTRVYCAHEYTLDNIRFARVVEPHNPQLLQREQECLALQEQGIPTVPSQLGMEKQINPFLRSHVPDVISAAEEYAGEKLAEPSRVFGVVRRWKDDLD